MDPLVNGGEIDRRLDFAAAIARATGDKLLALRSSGRWTDEVVLGDIADQTADAYLQGCLRGRYPDDGILSEETADDPVRRQRRLCWIVDPLDGTKEYRSGRHDWAVHVGLARDGAPVLGAVALPAIGRVLAGVCVPGRERVAVLGDAGDWRRDLAADAGEPRPLRLAVSRSHTPPWIERLREGLAPRFHGAEFVPSGSVGFKVALLLFGMADVYAHDKGLKEWDTLAPEVIARAAGWSVSRLDGSPMPYNCPDPRNDELLVCRPRVREAMLAALQAHAPRSPRGQTG